MGWLIDFFKWLYKMVAKASEYVFYLPAQLTILCLTFASSIIGVVELISSHSDSFSDLAQDTTLKVQQINTMIDSSPIGNLLGYCLGLDVAWEYTTTLAYILTGFVGVLFLMAFSGAVTIFVIPFIFRAILKLISVFTGGFVKP